MGYMACTVYSTRSCTGKRLVLVVATFSKIWRGPFHGHLLLFVSLSCWFPGESQLKPQSLAHLWVRIIHPPSHHHDHGAATSKLKSTSPKTWINLCWPWAGCLAWCGVLKGKSCTALLPHHRWWAMLVTTKNYSHEKTAILVYIRLNKLSGGIPKLLQWANQNFLKMHFSHAISGTDPSPPQMLEYPTRSTWNHADWEELTCVSAGVNADTKCGFTTIH